MSSVLCDCLLHCLFLFCHLGAIFSPTHGEGVQVRSPSVADELFTLSVKGMWMLSHQISVVACVIPCNGALHELFLYSSGWRTV